MFIVLYCVLFIVSFQINIDEYTGEENEEKNPYPVNDFPGASKASALNFF